MLFLVSQILCPVFQMLCSVFQMLCSVFQMMCLVSQMMFPVFQMLFPVFQMLCLVSQMMFPVFQMLFPVFQMLFPVFQMLFPVFQMLCQVLVSCACLLAAASCCLVSATGLSQGPLCLYNSSSGPTWGVPLQPLPDRHSGYLYNRTLWSGVCLEPGSVVQWNVVLFSVMGGTSGLQTLLCGFNVLNSLLGLILGQGFCHNKVSPVSV
ncbi:transmembrane 4 L6 family member 5-like isoform X1 [Amphiprion ocellaris]|uniref:transmembrane 4 L6 family member 5-like isoform X1 n=1 Tax=Amphiprion ocellaris TaxID=80972 RepID=UPI002410FCE9|nr:transmembrane 4 L6 family member 5-like isoform X1 [Amphiprion ocellaris]